jgi:hypothetical protein
MNFYIKLGGIVGAMFVIYLGYLALVSFVLSHMVK